MSVISTHHHFTYSALCRLHNTCVEDEAHNQICEIGAEPDLPPPQKKKLSHSCSSRLELNSLRESLLFCPKCHCFPSVITEMRIPHTRNAAGWRGGGGGGGAYRYLGYWSNLTTRYYGQKWEGFTLPPFTSLDALLDNILAPLKIIIIGVLGI